jgi:hypothetical protein
MKGLFVFALGVSFCLPGNAKKKDPEEIPPRRTIHFNWKREIFPACF